MFHPELPAELALLILSYLPLSSIGYLRRINQEWSYFIKKNSATVYRNAAFQEGFIERNHALLSEFDGTATGTDTVTESGDDSVWITQGAVGYEHEQGLYSKKALRGVHSWETLCKRQKLINSSWAGHAPSRILSSPRALPSPLALNLQENSHYRRVHRIKVDEQVGITLATTELGGLVVRDIETDEVLWELPIWYVHSHAHLEYERGYIIFDRTDGSKEVWRRTRDIEAEDARRHANASSTSDAREDIASDSSTKERLESDTGDDGEELPRPEPDQRQLHVANYLHTLATAYTAAAASPGSSPPSSAGSSPISQHPSAFLPSPSSPTRTGANAKATSAPRTSKAHFTPFAVLHLPAPESSCAFRFVYPSLLVAAMDRAYVFDVPGARVVQVIESVQRVRRVPVAEDVLEEDGSRGEEGGSSGGSTSIKNASRDGPAVASGSAGQQRLDENEADHNGEHSENEEHQDDPDATLAQFVGQIRYVEISPRHVFIAGRHVLRVFSRATGRCVLNLGSTRERYGAWAWRVAEGASEKEDGPGAGVPNDEVVGQPAEGSKGKEKATESSSVVIDTYDRARVEGREAVRVPLRDTFRSEMHEGGYDGMVIDQFMAVHVSRDGKHFVALLSGARLIIVHHFEALLERHRVPSRTLNRHSGNWMKDAMVTSMDKAMRNIAHTMRDKDLFMHTMDIRLGSPRVTDSVYLAYEHGRIGVVTSNAIYIVTPTPPPPPAPLSAFRPGNFSYSSSAKIRYPYPPTIPLHITRLPYFVNPSWLGAVTCLMMSDTGLYLNWNPTTPVSSAQRNRDGHGLGSVFGSLNPFVALHLDEQDDHRNDNDEQDELDYEDWVHEGDDIVDVDDVDDDDDDGIFWLHQDHTDGDEEQDTADADMDDETQSANDGGDATQPILPLLAPPPATHPGNFSAGHSGDHGRAIGAPSNYDPGRDEHNRSIWEAEYHRDLRDMEVTESEWYQVLPNGDMFVAPNPRPIEVSEVSTIFAVEFVPQIESVHESSQSLHHHFKSGCVFALGCIFLIFSLCVE